MGSSDTYYGIPYPKDPEPQLKDWPLTGKKHLDDLATERQFIYLDWLTEKYGYRWRVDPRSITKGIASGLISWFIEAHKLGKPVPMPGWATVIIRDASGEPEQQLPDWWLAIQERDKNR